MTTYYKPVLKAIENIRWTTMSERQKAEYAYALSCCKFPASVNPSAFQQKVIRVCDAKLKEINGSFDNFGSPAKRKSGSFFNLDLRGLSEFDLIALHSDSQSWYRIRRDNEMEPFARTLQWRIVNELLKRDESSQLAQILYLAECLEADNYANNINLPYIIGQKPQPFTPEEYSTDEELVCRIKLLSYKADYIAREELIEIADYIQLTIVDTGKIPEHLPLLNAILSTGMPCFTYARIIRILEKTVKRLIKSHAMSHMDLASVYHTLWSLTLKPGYLNLFETTARHAYFALAKGKTYPNLGIDRDNPQSISSVIKFLNDNCKTLWVLNDKYNVDEVIKKSKVAL